MLLRLNILPKLIKFILFYKELQKLSRFKDIYYGDEQRCFIAGNGPSIATQDLTKISDEVLFVTNSFVFHDQYEQINPDYYCVSDAKFWKDGIVDKNWYDVMMKKTSKSTKFFPTSFKSVAVFEKLFQEHELYYLNYSHLKIWEVGSMSLDITKWVHSGDTVIVDFCLPLAFYMGFREIYLIGCDTDYGLDEAENYSKGYFYDPSKDEIGPQVSNEYVLKNWVSNVIRSYEISKKVFENHDRKILNATAGGKLEVFPRVDYDALF